MCYQGLHNPSPASSTGSAAMFQQPQRSIFDNLTEPLQSLSVLIKSDKRFARAATSIPTFLPNPQIALSTIPRRQNLFGPPALETDGVGGCHIEHNTLLGRILRIGAFFQDPKIFEMFKDTWKLPANVVESNIVKIRSIMSNIQSQASDIILCLLKAGPQAKDTTMKWIFQAVFFNAEAEKDRPSPLISASQGFLFNFAGTLLRLARPIITDPKKLAKVDWKFLLWAPSKEVLGGQDSTFFFPSSSTRLMGVGSDNDTVLVPNDSTEFNFISQSFFCALRVLHLGAVQECIRYPNILRALSRLSAGFEVGDMNSLHHLSLKCTMDASLVCSDLMSDVMLFIPAFASSLLNQLQEESSTSNQVDVTADASWTVPQASSEDNCVKVMRMVPEHFVDDSMELLLFIAKSNPKCLSVTSMTPVLELILFLMRYFK